MANKKFSDYVVAGDNITLTYNNIADTVTIDAAGNVDSVNGKTGVVVLTKTDVGLSNVDNTSDANKPISTATQTALNLKQNSLVSGTNIKTINSNTLLGSGDVVIDKTSVGLSNVTNVDTTNASNILSGTLGDARLSANVTLQGNTFNAANKLVQLDGTAKLPAVDGSQLTNLPTPATPTLASVTTAGNTTTNAITVNKLTVTGTSEAYNMIVGSASDATNWNQFISTEGTGEYGIFQDAFYFQALSSLSNGLRFFNGTTGVMQFSQNGNFSIGTTTDAGFKLDVNGSTRIKGVGSTGATNALIIENSANTNILTLGNDGFATMKFLDCVNYLSLSDIRSRNTNGIVFQNLASTVFMKFHNTGNFSIGTTTDAGYKLDVNGSTRLKGAGATGSTNALLVQNSSGVQLLKIRDDGFTTIGQGNQGLDSPNATFSGYLISTGTNGNVFGVYTSFAASAIVQCDSTTRGFLPPRMTTTQKNAIATPAAGLVVYDTTDNKHYGYNGTTWNAFY